MNINHSARTYRAYSFLFIVLVFLAANLLISKSLTAGQSEHQAKAQKQSQNPNAPKETAHFGQLVGQWAITDYGLNQQGKWQAAKGADWNFYWILNGTAIQDDWISPSLASKAPNGRQFGTNVRIYNPKLKQWEMAWTANTSGKVETFTAISTKEQITMRGNYGGKETRITFYDISPTHFSWKMEQAQSLKETDKKSKVNTKAILSATPGAPFGDNLNWKEVYRIEAERKR